MKPREWLTKPHSLFRHVWARRGLLGGRWFYLEVFVIGLFGVAGIYFATNHLVAYLASYPWSPELPIDRQIPPVAWMIVPYASLYLLTPGAIILHPTNDRGRMELLLAAQGVVALSAFHAIFFLLFPADIALRDQLPADIQAYEGLFGAIFEFIHAADNPTNAWPSLHISLSYVICRVMTIWLDRDYAETSWGKPLKWALWINWGLLCISVLTTKQHFIFDLFTGFIVAYFWWWLLEPGFAKIAATADADIGF
jgi:hypothetical protein